MILKSLTTRSALHCQGLDLLDPEISVVLCDDALIESLNITWRGEQKPTDVLSFPSFEPEELDLTQPGLHLGDIIINLDYVERLLQTQTHKERVSTELGVPKESLDWGVNEEVEFLFIHGLLHLVGHDHAEPEEEAHMKNEEKRLWLAASPARIS